MGLEASSASLFKKQVEKNLIERLVRAAVREGLLPYTLQDNVLTVSLTRSKKRLVAHDVKQYSLGKLNIHGDVFLITQDNNQHLPMTISQLLDLIDDELNTALHAPQWQLFVNEMSNCHDNAVLAKTFMQTVNHQLSQKMQYANAKTLIEYIGSHYSTNEQLRFFEAWAASGHPYHPCHKTKLGFNKEEYLTFSPEFSEDIHLPVVAVLKSLLHVEQEEENSDYLAWFAEHYPSVWQSYLQALNASELAMTDYYPVFVHPWQYDNVLTTLFSDKIEKKELVLFNTVKITAKPSLSFRTLMTNDDQEPHIKLPVAVHSTSAMRTISPASVQNGPKLARILKHILRQEESMHQHIQFAYESCSLHIKHANDDIAKHLGIIYRDNPSKYLSSQQVPIVVAALFEKSPRSQLPLFIEIMQSAVGDQLENALHYFAHYCQIVVRAYFDLFLLYGIALEGHQQNTIAVFENAYPTFMIARDFGAFRIHAPTLNSKGFDLKPYPKSVTVTDDQQEVTNNFLHTVIQYHLGEMVLLLAQHYHTSETLFWKIVKDHLYERFQALKAMLPLERSEHIAQAIFENDWQIKGLMRMRLNNVCNEYIYLHFKNPLRDTECI